MIRHGFCIAIGLCAVPVVAQAQASDPRTETSHVVKPGETLGGIANRAQVPRVLIIEANALKPPYAVKAGQRLIIPRRRSHDVKEGETGFSIAMNYGVPWATIAAANKLDPQAAVKPGQTLVIPTVSVSVPPAATTTAKAVPVPAAKPTATPTAQLAPTTPAAAPVRFVWPVIGKVRRGFAPRTIKDYHDGVDIVAAKGTPVRASAAGNVIFAGQGPREYGNTVIIHHGQRWTTVYSYLDKITVRVGNKVKAGERIGLAGQTGLATEPQLHFEVRQARAALDPEKQLPQQP